jgi:transposase
VVSLDATERERLESLVSKGRESARVIRRAHTLLQASEGRLNREIAATLRVSELTVINTTKAYARQGLDAALFESPRPGASRKLDGRAEAALMLLACRDPPEGRAKWSLRLRADTMVALDVVEELSYQTVRRTLKKTTSSHG